MAIGSCTFTNLGSYDVSGAAIKTIVDAQVEFNAGPSGSSIHFVPVSNGQQVQVYRVDVT